MNILLVTPTSVTYEISNKDCYYNSGYDLYLNDTFLFHENKNVVSVYNLEPNTEYKLKFKFNDTCIEKEIKTENKKVRIIKPLSDVDNTQELQNEINNSTINDLLILDGIFKITALFLKDNVSICLLKNTKLIGNTKREDFPILKGDEFLNGLPLGTWEGHEDDSFASIITGLGVSNVLIYGEGIIDCKAQESDWWINHRVVRIARRPKGIFLHTCNNIVFEGFTVCNTPSWNQHPFYSTNLKYYNLNLINPANSPTTDGCDPESCTNVEIIGTHISVGDDCIAIKSGKLDFARKYHTPSSNIIIRNCLMEYGHAGVTLGSENSGGINNVKVSNCLFRMTDRGLRIKSQRGRGNLAVIENISFDNILMDDVKSPFVINAFYKSGSDAIDERYDRDVKPVTDLTPTFNSFTFKNIKCSNVSFGLGFFLGLPESKIKEINLENINVSYKEDAEAGEMAMTAWKEKFKGVGIVAENVGTINIKNLSFENKPSNKFILKNVDSVKE